MAKWTIPAELRYAKSDEWIKIENGEATVGVSDYAQDSLSDIVFVEFPDVGASFEAGKGFGTIESVKAASDLNMPIGGTIIAVNSGLEDTPEKINEDPYGAWLIKFKPSHLAELDALMDAAAYTKYCEERG